MNKYIFNTWDSHSIKKVPETMGNKKTKSHGRHIEDSLSDHKAHREEQVTSWQKGQD